MLTPPYVSSCDHRVGLPTRGDCVRDGKEICARFLSSPPPAPGSISLFPRPRHGHGVEFPSFTASSQRFSTRACTRTSRVHIGHWFPGGRAISSVQKACTPVSSFRRSKAISAVVFTGHARLFSLFPTNLNTTRGRGKSTVEGGGAGGVRSVAPVILYAVVVASRS